MSDANPQRSTIVRKALRKAHLSIQRGDLRDARRWAERAARLDPDREEPWLILAALASPRGSIAYLDRALEINPLSQSARKGMRWAVQRWRNQEKVVGEPGKLIDQEIPLDAWTHTKPAILPWAAAILILLLGVIFWFGTPQISLALQSNKGMPVAYMALDKATFTPSPTPTFTATPTLTPTSTPTNTPTSSPTPTATRTKRPSATPLPTATKKSTKPNPVGPLPPGVKPGERWIDVNLSTQRSYAYQGKNLIKSFVVSTGTWRYPTVTGQYRIYVKYRYAPMSGPGYYLPNVPYVMYFYRGYGLHGTYWHNNFGTPMSHGCVNYTIESAGWIFNWASVGTLVNIHY